MAKRNRLSMLADLVVDRLRTHPMHTVTFAIVGVVTAEIVNLTRTLERLERHGWDAFLQRWPREVLGFLVICLLIAFVLRAATGKGSSLAQRPLKFVAVLVLGTSLAALFGTWVSASIGGISFTALSELPVQNYFNLWMQSTVWGGLIGWIYMLSLQHADDRERLNTMLGKRVLLARQLAQARLGAARAQIDPAMVARILTEVHRRYQVDQPGASALLDHLISYLRLAMHRGRNAKPSYAGELALVRALIGLREAEHRIVVTLHNNMNESELSAAPDAIFLHVRTLLDQAIQQGVSSVRIVLTSRDGQAQAALAHVPVNAVD